MIETHSRNFCRPFFVFTQCYWYGGVMDYKVTDTPHQCPPYPPKTT